MRRYQVLVMMVALLSPSLLSAQTHEPKDGTRVVDCNLSALKCAGQVKRGTFYDDYKLPIVSDASATISPPGVGEFLLPEGRIQGGGEIGWYDDLPSTSLYFATWIKLSPTFTCNLPGLTKTSFIRSMNRNPGGGQQTNGFFGLEGCGDEKAIVWSHNTGKSAHSIGLDNSHICQKDLGLYCPPNMAGPRVRRGEWGLIEGCQTSSKTMTSRDGSIRWWYNGKPVGRYLGANTGPWSNEWNFTPTWDGTPKGNGDGYGTTVSMRLDHLIINVGGTCSDDASDGAPPVSSPVVVPPGSVTGVTLAVKG